jgi:uncharacterized membrane protein YjjP (DUF1212 family)
MDDISIGKILFITILIALIIIYILKGPFWLSIAIAFIIIYVIPAYIIIKKIYRFFKGE